MNMSKKEKTKNLIYPLWVALIAVSFSLAPTILLEGHAAPPPGDPGVRSMSLTGDNPLTTLESFDGKVDVVVQVVPHTGGTNPSGTFTISTIPAGATIRRAWFITTSFSAASTESAALTFAGASFGTKPPNNTDPGGDLFCREYRFDVTSRVPGNGSYPYNVNGTGNTYGDALVVVFEHSSLPVRRIVINSGAESLQTSTSTTTFAGFAAGAGRMIVFTQADNVSIEGGESLALNGTTVLGPGDIFNANQGDFASLIDIPVTTVAGANSMAVTTGVDFFGLHLGILIGASGAAAVVCDVQMNKTSYVNGDTVIAQVLRIANPTALPLAIEFKLWLEAPGSPPTSFARGGADGSVVLPVGFSQNVGPLTLFTVTAALPRGTYAFDCRFLHPVTGGLQAEDLNPFTIQ